jgi:hypothetical protein
MALKVKRLAREQGCPSILDLGGGDEDVFKKELTQSRCCGNHHRHIEMKWRKFGVCK